MYADTIPTMTPDTDTIWKILAGLGVGTPSLIFIVRRMWSRDAVMRASDESTIDALSGMRLILSEERKDRKEAETFFQSQLAEERRARKEAEERADRFAHERNEAIQMVGGLKMQVNMLTEQVAQLTHQTELMRGQINAAVKPA